MKIVILTIFPKLFDGFLNSSLIHKAIVKELISIDLVDIRDFADAPHKNVDDIPYGGGAGMVMKPEPLLRAIRHAKTLAPEAVVTLLSPSGSLFTQVTAIELSTVDLILVCGRYEGIDQRVIDLAVDRELSVGDFVLMGGEVASMVVIEAATRLVPGVIGNADSLSTESFNTVPGSGMTLEAPQYTRPPEFEGKNVPDVLLSGNHERIKVWREQQSAKITAARRPDLLTDKKVS